MTNINAVGGVNKTVTTQTVQNQTTQTATEETWLDTTTQDTDTEYTFDLSNPQSVYDVNGDNKFDETDKAQLQAMKQGENGTAAIQEYMQNVKKKMQAFMQQRQTAMQNGTAQQTAGSTTGEVQNGQISGQQLTGEQASAYEQSVAAKNNARMPSARPGQHPWTLPDVNSMDAASALSFADKNRELLKSRVERLEQGMANVPAEQIATYQALLENLKAWAEFGTLNIDGQAKDETTVEEEQTVE